MHPFEITLLSLLALVQIGMFLILNKSHGEILSNIG
jgi:hypothetical protein